MALSGRRPAGVGVLAPLLVFALTVFLSVLGYSTPSPDLPVVTLGNLGGGMAMLALLWWMSQRAAEPVEAMQPGLRIWAFLGLVILILQIGLGAWTSASFAGPSCSALPGCDVNWQSPEHLREGFDLTARLAIDNNGKVMTGAVQQTVHMAHRLGAAVTFLFLTALAFRAVSLDARFRGTCMSIIMLLVVQVCLGVAGILTALPLLLVTAHNAVAALLLLAVVNLIHLATPRRKPAQA
jgi:cytochrome c oxidase assembly protein subunit 15